MRLAAVAFCFVALAAIGVEASEPSTSGSQAIASVGSGQEGSPGLHRVATAQAAQPGELLLGLSGQYSTASSFLVDGDQNQRQTGVLVIGFAPIDYLWVSGSWALVSNQNNALTPQTTGYRGSPTLNLKGRYPITSTLAAGAMLSVTIPTSADGKGLAPDAAVYQANAVVSYDLLPSVVVAANAGYAVDRMLRLYGDTANAATRYVAGIYGADAATFGLGAQSLFALSPAVAAGGFVELSGLYALGTQDAVNPLRASIGFKLLVPASHNLELVAGSDLRLTGAPKSSSQLPGIPPWEAFLRVAGRWAFFARAPLPPPPPTPPSPPPCGPEHPCAEGQICEAGTCVAAPPPPPKPPPTFEVRGSIIDKATQSSVAGAKVVVSGVDAAPLKLDAQAGTFSIGPIVVNDGLVNVRVEATGYRPAEQTMPKGPGGAVTEVKFELISLAKTLPGVVKGVIIDADTGKPVKGRVALRGSKKKMVTDDKGAFSFEVKAGRYEILIVSPRYIPQTKTVELTAGDVVILNIDMTPRRR